MKRLTKRAARKLYIKPAMAEIIEISDNKDFIKEQNQINIYNKLADLEDIEEEAGISLNILFKACKNGFYYENCGIISYACKQDNGEIYFNSKNIIYLERNYFETDVDYYALKDYGKTWALTEEELK